MLLRVVAAQVEALRRHVTKKDTPAIVIKAAEDAADCCLPLLEQLAGNQQTVDDVTPLSDMDFQQSPDFLKDWAAPMADVFRLGPGASFDALLTRTSAG